MGTYRIRVDWNKLKCLDYGLVWLLFLQKCRKGWTLLKHTEAVLRCTLGCRGLHFGRPWQINETNDGQTLSGIQHHQRNHACPHVLVNDLFKHQGNYYLGVTMFHILFVADDFHSSPMDLELFLFQRLKRYYGHGSNILEFHVFHMKIADSCVHCCMIVSKFNLRESLVLSYQHVSSTCM